MSTDYPPHLPLPVINRKRDFFSSLCKVRRLQRVLHKRPTANPTRVNYWAMALTKYGITYFNATPALCEDGNSCAYFWEASSGKWQTRFGIAVT